MSIAHMSYTYDKICNAHIANTGTDLDYLELYTMKLLRWIIFIPVLIMVYYVSISFTDSMFKTFAGDRMSNYVTLPATIIKCLMYLFCGFVGTALSCYVAPGKRVTISLTYLIVTTVMVFFVARASFRLELDVEVAWLVCIPFFFSIIGSLINYLYMRYESKKAQ